MDIMLRIGAWQLADMRFGVFLSVLTVTFLAQSVDAEGGDIGASREGKNRNAYATMLYTGTPRDYEFFVATRVMIRSLRGTRPRADILVIVDKEVPEAWRQNMLEDGGIVLEKEDIPNPFLNRANTQSRFKHAVNKLHVWSLLEYERVVWLDTDNIFLQNVDELFQCGEFCAVFINPCYFHTGLFVLKPSNATFHDMLEKYPLLSNRDGADQGFLVSYYSNLLHAPYFRPPADGSQLSGTYRLSFGYQMDHSYYIIRLNWLMDGKQCIPSSVITYPGAADLKPWYWWSWPVMPLSFGWHEIRRSTIGYPAENRIAYAEAFITFMFLLLGLYFPQPSPGERAAPIKCCFSRIPFLSDAGHWRSGCTSDSQFWHSAAAVFWSLLFKGAVLSAITVSFIFPFWVIPLTLHPIAGWGLLLFMSLVSLLLLSRNRCLPLPLVPLLVPWLVTVTVLAVLGLPLYTNGLQRPLALGIWAVLASPILWWAVKRIMVSVDNVLNHSGVAEYVRVSGEGEPFLVVSRADSSERRAACAPRTKKVTS